MTTTVIDILEKLEATPGRNDKEDILRKNSDNELLKQVFVASQCPYTVYYVNKFKSPKPLETQVVDDDVQLNAFLTVLLHDLSTRAITGNLAKDTVSKVFGLMDARQQKWCQRIILKNMRCGVDTTVNKVWPGLIKTFTCALAETLEATVNGTGDFTLNEAIDYPVRVEPKLDGLRIIAIKEKGDVKLFTRNGSLLETLPRITKALEDLPFDDIVFDGEGMADNAGTEAWNESASVIMAHKTMKDDKDIVFNVFDSMRLDEWKAQRCSRPYVDRVNGIEVMFEGLPEGSPLRQVPGIEAANEDELRDFYVACIDDDYEGVMVKHLAAPYTFKRSSAILKLKPVATYEGVIVDHYEGRRGTKREGFFGGFDVLLPNGVITRVGGGFNDAFRAVVQLNGPDSYKGKIIEVEGQPPLTKDGKVRFPVYMRQRDPSDVDPKILEVYETWRGSSSFIDYND